jgi:hypothetical protein
VKCAACNSEDGVVVFAIAVNGELLRLQVPLCNVHGNRYLILAGQVIGQLLSGMLDRPEEGKPAT